MASRMLVLLLTVLLALAAPAAAAPTLPLSHSGRWITDADGRVVTLHGHNMVYKRPPYTPAATGFGDDDAAFLAGEGVNTMRVGIIYKAVEPTPGTYDDAYLDSIASTVEALGAHGIVSLLDFHQDLFNERFQGEGFPDWAVQDDGLPNPSLGFPGNYLGNSATQRAFDHFWANDGGLQDRYAAAWAHVAARFRDNPHVLGYDLFNEPWPGTAWEPCANPAGCPEFDGRLGAFVTRTLTAIRAVDPETLVFYEPNVLFNNGAATALPDFGDERLAMSFHDYCLTAESGSSGCAQFDDLVFSNADARAEQTGDALLLTEWGAIDDPDVLVPMAERADRFMIGWQHWHYCNCDDPTTSGEGDVQAIVLDPAKPPAGDNLKPAKLKLLSRPYPQVVAGVPLGWSFDGATSTFRAEWTAADGVTELAMPERQYPKGYAVAVEGGRTVSKGDVLRVRRCPGAPRVGVVVTPSGTSKQTCVAPPLPRLRVQVTPKRIRAGRRSKLHITVTARRVGRTEPVRGASIRGRRTGPRGQVTIRVRPKRAGRLVLRAKARGFRAGRAVVRVRR